MAGTDKRKQLLYLTEEMLAEVMREANRLDRSLSWTVQQAWRIAREQVRKFPGAEVPRDADPQRDTDVQHDRRAHPRTLAAVPADADVAPPPRRERPDWDRARAEADLREFLRGKFDRDVVTR